MQGTQKRGRPEENQQGWAAWDSMRLSKHYMLWDFTRHVSEVGDDKDERLVGVNLVGSVCELQ